METSSSVLKNRQQSGYIPSQSQQHPTGGKYSQIVRK